MLPRLFIWATLALFVLPAVGGPADAAVAYLPEDITSGVGDCVDADSNIIDCSGLRIGDLDELAQRRAPEGECIYPPYGLTFECDRPDIITGTSTPAAGYMVAKADSAMQDPDCAAQGAQWCVTFAAAIGNVQINPTCCISSSPVKITATIHDTCRPTNNRVYFFERVSSGAAVWEDAISGSSLCNAKSVAFIIATLTATDPYTGAVLYQVEDRTLYGPEGWILVAGWVCDNPAAHCKFHANYYP